MACKKEIVNEPLSGQIDARTQIGEALWRDFRVILNASMVEGKRLGRMPGWHGLMKFYKNYDVEVDENQWSDRCNRDLHDQLLQCSGYYNHAYLRDAATIPDLGMEVTLNVDDTTQFSVGDVLTIRDFNKLILLSKNEPLRTITVRNNAETGGPVSRGDEILGTFVQLPAEREPINMHAQLTSACETRVFIAGTRSRLYASTGISSNWRILADGLGGERAPGHDLYGSSRWQYVQMGNYVLFSNDYDPVLAWRIGDGPSCYSGWSVGIVTQLLEIDILRVGCIAAWQGFVFVGDVETPSGRQCSQIYWSDFNSPLDWLPVGESASGYVDLGRGEKILRMDPMAGQLRVYTDRAIYNVVLVGGEEVFRFYEIYRGPDALAFRFALANCGDCHIYLTNTGIVELKVYDNTPTRTEWLHRASGLIYYGLDGRLLNQYPGAFKPFGPADIRRCNHIVCGYDSCRREVWISWPTIDEEPSELDGVRRMSMTVSRLYGSTSLVNHGFASFANFVPFLDMAVRDWMIALGACTPEEMREYILPKEGKPCNTPVPPDEIPEHIVNPDEDPNKPASPDSICALYGDADVRQLCLECSTPSHFSMSSLDDFTIKELTPAERYRERWNEATQAYEDHGYEFILQSESSMYGTGFDKKIYRLDVDYAQQDQAPPLNLHAQVGVSALPVCPAFWDSEPYPIDCSPMAEVNGSKHARPVGPASFPYYITGRYITWRLYLSSTPLVPTPHIFPTPEPPAYNFAPTGGIVDFSRVAITAYVKTTC